MWSDEFNGPSVNTSNWNFQTGCSGWGNGEWENYTSGANTLFMNDSRVNSSVLVIEARNTGGGNCGYTSRRRAELLIQAGRVAVNGKVLTSSTATSAGRSLSGS